MHVLKQVESEQSAATKRVVSRWAAFVNDLDLMISVTIARLLVWRTLRRRSRERAARLKQFKLVHGGNDHVKTSAILSLQNQETRDAGPDLHRFNDHLLSDLPRIRARVREAAGRGHS